MDLNHPDTGQHVRASISTAERLVSEGWEVISKHDDDTTASAPPKRQATSKKTATGDEGKQPETPKTDEKPLDKMKLTELIEHAEKIGVAAEQLEPLRKPGASKKQALEIIEAHTASE